VAAQTQDLFKIYNHWARLDQQTLANTKQVKLTRLQIRHIKVMNWFDPTLEQQDKI